MKERTYRLRELAAESGIEPRTIRWYISEGLVRGPEKMGRGAHYGQHHLKRLKTIRLLKESYGLPLAEIRRYILMAGDENIEVVPVRAPHVSLEALEEMADSAPAPGPSLPRPVARRARWRRERGRPHVGPRALQEGGEALDLAEAAVPPGQAPIEGVVSALGRMLGGRRVARQSRARSHTVIDITPDVALQVRGEYRPEELAQFERLADHLREALLGGAEGGGNSEAT